MPRGVNKQHLKARFSRVSACALVSLFACVYLQFPANAQDSPVTQVDYNIGAIPLDEALHLFAAQSGLQILFSPDVIEDKTTKPVIGYFEPLQALELIIADTGLEYAFTSPEFVIVRRTGPELQQMPSSDILNENDPSVGPVSTEIIRAQTESSVGPLETSSPILKPKGQIKGHVISEATGQALVGALISIPDLGLSEVTDNSGFFRLAKIPEGDYSIIVSYFGQNSEDYNVTIKLGNDAILDIRFGEKTPDEIIVTGVQSAYNNSINSHRSVDNIVSILATDLDGRFPDDTIAEALRRSPGITFERDERGGEGEFVSLRGLGAELNKVTINGQSAPTAGHSDDRRVPLDGFLADSVARITIHKTLLPEHPSEGIGGVIDVQTTGSTRPKNRKLAITGEGRYSGFNDKLGFLLSGQYSDTLGKNDELGLYASASFRRRLLRTYQFDVIGNVFPDQLPIGSNGQSLSDISSIGPAQFTEGDLSRIEDMRLNVFDDQRDVFSLVMAGDWRFSDTTQFNLSATYNELDIKDQRSSLSFEQSDTYTNVDENGALIDPQTGQYFFRGRSPFSRGRAEVEDDTSRNLVISADVNTQMNTLKLTYGAGFSSGQSVRPLSTEIDFETADFDDVTPLGVPSVLPTGFGYIEFDQTNRLVPVPQLTEAGFSYLTDPQNYAFRDLRIRSEKGRNDIYSAYFDGTWDSNSSFLKTLKSGLRFTHSNRRLSETLIFDDNLVSADGTFGGSGDFTFGDTNLLTGNLISLAPLDNIIPNVAGVFETDRDSVIAFRHRLLSTIGASEGMDVTGDSFERSVEKTLAGYISANIDLTPQFSLIGGVRVEQYWGEFQASRLAEVTVLDETTDIRADTDIRIRRRTTEFLPRISLTYRPSDQWLIKAGMFESIARPRFDTLNEPETIEINLDAGTARIDSPNPATENIQARNFDLSLQFFGHQKNFFEANAYYKTLSNFTIPDFGGIGGGYKPTDVSAPTDRLPARFGLTDAQLARITSFEIQRPIEGVPAQVYGIDLSYLHPFDAVPGYWDELGIRLSAGLQETSFTLRSDSIEPRQSPFINAPTFAGTASLWYKKERLNAYAIYSYQGRQLNSAEAFFPDEYVQPYSALDLRLEYKFPTRSSGQYTVYLAASDVLDDGLKPTTYETIGKSKRLLDDVEFNGRELRFGLKANF